MVLRLCDELDKAKELYDYFRETLTKYVEKTIVPSLRAKRDEVLLQEYVKEWKDYTVLVHYIRKMFIYLVRRYILLRLTN